MQLAEGIFANGEKAPGLLPHAIKKYSEAFDHWGYPIYPGWDRCIRGPQEPEQQRLIGSTPCNLSSCSQATQLSLAWVFSCVLWVIKFCGILR